MHETGNPQEMTMRQGVFGVLVALAIPAGALAQTPRDIANQLWPLGAPASVAQAPAPVAAPGGGAAGDLARLSAAEGVADGGASAASGHAVAGTGFVAADLARLRGGEGFEDLWSSPEPVVVAQGRGNGHNARP
jgi:hypothetical protein